MDEVYYLTSRASSSDIYAGTLVYGCRATFARETAAAYSPLTDGKRRKLRTERSSLESLHQFLQGKWKSRTRAETNANANANANPRRLITYVLESDFKGRTNTNFS